MANKQSAGILVYRQNEGNLEVLLAHPGGPFWAKKDKNAWTIPKGLIEGSDSPKDTAIREFKEETGQNVPKGELLELGTIKQTNGKTVYGWAVKGEIDTTKIKSNTFEMIWPPKSSQKLEFPEVDRAEWFTLPQAIDKIHVGQDEFLTRLANHLGIEFDRPQQPSLF